MQFHVPVHNEGRAAAKGVSVEFAIPELMLRHRETIDLEAGESVTVVFETVFSLQDFRRPLRPEITVDPDREIPEARRDNNRAVLLPLELEAASQPLVGPGGGGTQRARLELNPGDCVGFRFSGQETDCGGDADIEILVSPADGYTVILHAAALKPLPASSFAQVDRLPEMLTGTELPLEVGQLVAVQPRSGATVILRVAALRRSSAIRRPGTGRPRAVDVPETGRFPAEPIDSVAGESGSGALPLIQVEIEWIGGR